MASTRKPPSDYQPPQYHPSALESPPPVFAIVPAPPPPHDFTQQIIELNRSVATLEEIAKQLRSDVSEQGGKIANQSDKILVISQEISSAKATVKGAFYTGKWFLAGIAAIIGFIMGNLKTLLSFLHLGGQ